jgi:hypothetical protein
VTCARASLILFFAAVSIATWWIFVVVNVGTTILYAFPVKKVITNHQARCRDRAILVSVSSL